MIYRYIKRYPVSLLITIATITLSLIKTPETKAIKIENLDKVAHFIMYFGLCLVFWFEYLRTHNKISTIRIIIGGFLIPLFLGGMLEIMQAHFTNNRSGSIMDFLAGGLGVIAAAIIGLFIIRPILR